MLRLYKNSFVNYHFGYLEITVLCDATSGLHVITNWNISEDSDNYLFLSNNVKILGIDVLSSLSKYSEILRISNPFSVAASVKSET